MNRGRGLRSAGRKIVRAENIERFADDEAARRWRRWCVHIVVAIRHADRSSPHRLVFAQVAKRDDAAGLANFIDDAVRDFAVVKIFGALSGDAFQQRGKIRRMSQRNPGSRCVGDKISVWRNGLAGQANRGSEKLAPRPCPKTLVHRAEAGHRSRDRARHRPGRFLAEHSRLDRRGCGLAEIERPDRAARGVVVGENASASDS